MLAALLITGCDIDNETTDEPLPLTFKMNTPPFASSPLHLGESTELTFSVRTRPYAQSAAPTSYGLQVSLRQFDWDNAAVVATLPETTTGHLLSVASRSISQAVASLFGGEVPVPVDVYVRMTATLQTADAPATIYSNVEHLTLYIETGK